MRPDSNNETPAPPTPDPGLDSTSQPTQWLAATEVEPFPVQTGNATIKNRFSFWLILALIVGTTGPILACIFGALLPYLPRARPGTTEFATWTLIVIGLWGLPLGVFAAWEMIKASSIRWRLHWAWSAAGGAGATVLLVIGGLADYFHRWPTPVAALGLLLYLTLAALVLLGVIAHNWQGFGLTQAWAYLVGGGWLGLLLAAIVEVGLLLVLIVVLAIIGLITAPEQVRLFIQNSQTLTEFEIQQLLLDWAFKPWVIALVFLGASVVAPVIEEALKPVLVALSLFRGRPPTPMAAFLGGVMSGFGFGVIESLSQLANASGGQWGVLAAVRVGAVIMHGFASGLVGWGWGQLGARKPLRLIGAFTLAVAVHGLWNAMAVTAGLVGLRFTQVNSAGPSPELVVLGLLMLVAILTLLVMVASSVTGLIFLGWRLRSREANSLKSSEVVPVEPATQISAGPASVASATVDGSADATTPGPDPEPSAEREPPPRP